MPHIGSRTVLPSTVSVPLLESVKGPLCEKPAAPEPNALRTVPASIRATAANMIRSKMISNIRIIDIQCDGPSLRKDAQVGRGKEKMRLVAGRTGRGKTVAAGVVPPCQDWKDCVCGEVKSPLHTPNRLFPQSLKPGTTFQPTRLQHPGFASTAADWGTQGPSRSAASMPVAPRSSCGCRLS